MLTLVTNNYVRLKRTADLVFKFAKQKNYFFNLILEKLYFSHKREMKKTHFYLLEIFFSK